MLSCICSKFSILGLDSQILCRNRKKLENIFTSYISLCISMKKFKRWLFVLILIKTYVMQPNLKGKNFDILGNMVKFWTQTEKNIRVHKIDITNIFRFL